ncbi:MAG: PaaI family thioesterase [Alphaproteobacteria bacterium]|nr:PaaI family thioesterase [Alphaproteobacteria bacterium]
MTNDEIRDQLANSGSRSRALLGGRFVALDAAAGTVRMAFDAGPDLITPTGVVQGGFVCAMLDETMAMAALANTNLTMWAPTLELKTSFIGPAQKGTLYCDGRVIRMGKSVAFLEGTLSDGQGQLVATASATARMIPRK